MFFLSGFAAVAYQVVWQKVLTQTIGIDAISIVIVVSVFMLGLGVGGIAGGELTRTRANLLKVYVAAEVVLAVFGVLSVPLLRAVGSVVAADTGYVPDVAANVLALFLPTFLMGLTLPIVLHLFRDAYPVGTAVGVVYAVNILGAAAGALAAGLVLVGTLGMLLTCRLLAGVNVLLAATVIWRLRRGDRGAPVASGDGSEPAGASGVAAPVPSAQVIAASLAAGFVALGYEVVLFRIFIAYFAATSYVFPLLLFAYLLALAVGTWLFGRLADRWRNPASVLSLAAAGTAAGTLLVLYGQEAIHIVGFRQDLLALWPFPTWLALVQLPAIAITALVLMAPVAALAGFFPTLVRLATSDQGSVGLSVGRVYFSQTMGNFLGVAVTGLVLLPAIGTIGTLRALGAIVLIIPCGLLLRGVGRPERVATAMLVAGAAVVAIYPADFYRQFRYYQGLQDTPPVRPAEVREDAQGVTLGYELADGEHLSVFMGREFTTSISTAARATIDCFPIDLISALRHYAPRSALYIGLGSGAGPYCLQASFPGIRVQVVELNPQLIHLMETRGNAALHDALRRSDLVLADGRRYLLRQPDRRFDFVQVGVNNSTGSGAGNVFSKEFIAAIKERLTPDGVLTFNAYPPVVRAALDVFDELAIVSPGTHAISHVVAVNGARTGLVERLDLERLRSVATPRAHPPITIARGFEQGCILPRDVAARLLQGISTATDDLLATEYFLTNRQYVYPVDPRDYRPRNYRVYDCEPGSTPIRALLGT